MSVKEVFKGGLLFVVSVVLVMLLFAGVSKANNLTTQTKEEVVNTPIGELAELPFEELMKISDKFDF